MDQPVLDTKSLFAPKKGKQATKGQKQIYEENKETLKFYAIMASAAFLLKLVLSFIPWFSNLSLWLLIFEILVQSAGVAGMYYMSKPVISGTTRMVVDGGIDLNLKGGFADYLKDLIITTTICSVLSIFSNYFWLLWLFFPGLCGYQIWVKVIGPWIFAPAPEEAPEVADKKRKKMERKMARAGYR